MMPAMQNHDRQLIVSNNPCVWDRFAVCVKVEGPPLAVLYHARDLIHLGRRLAGHPLAGSIRLLSNPFRSVLLGPLESEPDCRSVCLIEESLARLSGVLPSPTDSSGEKDYQLIDLSLLENVSSFNLNPLEGHIPRDFLR